MNKKVIYLSFHDTIDLHSVNQFMDFTNKAIVQYDPDKICYLFSSGGGAVDSGVTLYNFIRGLPQEVEMHNIGSIDSIANAVFLAGDKRYASRASAFLLHGVSWTFHQGSSLSYTQMQETVSRFNSAEQLTASIIQDRTKLSEEEVRSLFNQGASKDPQFALDKGLIDEIREVSINVGEPVHSILRNT